MKAWELLDDMLDGLSLVEKIYFAKMKGIIVPAEVEGPVAKQVQEYTEKQEQLLEQI